MIKVKTNFLKKVLYEGEVETRKYIYRVFKPNDSWEIRRTKRKNSSTTYILNKENWELIAITFDTEKFIHI